MTSGAIRVRAAVCICAGDRILLVEHVKDGRHRWLLPGGGVERGETLVDAANREATEETGLVVTVGRLVLLSEVIEPGGRHLLDFVFLATIAGGELRAGRDGRLTAVSWHHRDELAGLALHPPINSELTHAWGEDFSGGVRLLGNVWRPDG